MQATPEQQPKARILVVEDEVVVARDLQQKLKALGYSVPVVAVSAKAVVEQAAAIHPDIVLMDIMLRDGDGIEAAGRLRSRFDVPVVYLTAFSDDETLERARASGPYGYILKPFDIHYVRIIIEMALHRHGLEKEKSRLIAELQSALEHVKLLKGLFPICAWCKKIRDDDGYWQEVETYLHDHSEADFSHGICPECSERLRREFIQKRMKPDS